MRVSPQVMAQILKDMGITEYEPRVINQMLEFAYSERGGAAGRRGPAGRGGDLSPASSFPRVRDHDPGRREDLLQPRQEVQRGRGRREVGDPVPHRSVLHVPTAPRCELRPGAAGRAGA